MVCNVCSHRGSYAESLVNTTEVVVHEMEGNRMFVIFDFLREGIRQAREAAHLHSHGEVLALNVARRDMSPVGIARNRRRDGSNANRGAVARFFLSRLISVQLDQHRVVNLIAESQINRVEISLVTVSSELNAIRETSGEIVHEVLSVPCGPSPDAPARNKFGICANRRPRPHIAIAEFSAQVAGNILFFRIAERPNLVALDSLAWQVAKRLVLIFGAHLADSSEKFCNGVFRYACHPYGSPNRITLNKSGDYCDLAFGWEVVHV